MRIFPMDSGAIRFRALLAGLLLALNVQAQTPEDDEDTETQPFLRTSLQTWFYVKQSSLAGASKLNPGNRLLNIPEESAIVDMRPELRTSQDRHEAVLKPRFITRNDEIDYRNPVADSDSRSSRFHWNEAFFRSTFGSETITAGRELLSWGPAIFRSPSNPFYFDAGRTDPLRETPGIDLVRLTHSLTRLRITGARIFNTATLNAAANQSSTWLIKIDALGEGQLGSLIASQRKDEAPFVGAFMQATPDDAWLVYGEWGSSRKRYALMPSSTAGAFPLQQPSPRRSVELVGASRTLATGQVVTGEYLYYGHGYSRQDENLFFQQLGQLASLQGNNPGLARAGLASAVSYGPSLLGRSYLYLSWQSNPQDTAFYWRAESVRNIQDRSYRLQIYVERNFTSRLSGFASLSWSGGAADTEFTGLVHSTLALGIKAYIF